MAKLERSFHEDFDRLLHRIENGIANGSISASLEDSSDFRCGEARCSVRVFERYSVMGSNRLSMSVTLFQVGDGPVQLSAITAGGSQAMLFKMNTFGEQAFLEKLEEIL
ncbi:MAG: hypothetical protein IJD26_08140 [Lachnospiraceae bacterium]|nr:hypothetical protein [Lachnospiraceae bacterium]